MKLQNFMLYKNVPYKQNGSKIDIQDEHRKSECMHSTIIICVLFLPYKMQMFLTLTSYATFTRATCQ